MADGHALKVTLNVTAGNEPPITETTEFDLDAMSVAQIKVPQGQPVTAKIAPQLEHATDFLFLLIRPMLLGEATIKATDLVEQPETGKTLDHPAKTWLTYSIEEEAASTPKQAQQTATESVGDKPLRGAHVFVNGQTDWITDGLNDKTPTAITFWNNKPPAPQDDWDKLPQQDKDKVLKDRDGKPLEGAAKDDAVKDWLKARHEITVQIIVGYRPVGMASATTYTRPQR